MPWAIPGNNSKKQERSASKKTTLHGIVSKVEYEVKFVLFFLGVLVQNFLIEPRIG